jgi:hypothetical protein
MLITFKSSASSNVLMFETAAKDFLRCIGKAPDEATGIITVEQLPAAIDSVRMAMAADKTEPRRSDDTASKDGTGTKGAGEIGTGTRETGAGEDDEPVSFAQRALPMLELLERAQAEGVPVVWGV